ncbi:uncharacterized protein PAC_05265 [Phialocephala subalpina]|uniref:QLQ domain-containing protein n=1 Tax=Phialocephala subalpina TaxID=576137 RepID=A0A1L7WRI5_9HELO|nr:uncharacterized protein PAC_05265 [Phialocephala subalpina]
MAIDHQSGVLLNSEDAIHHTLTSRHMLYSLSVNEQRRGAAIENSPNSKRRRYVKALPVTQSQVQTTPIEHSEPRGAAGYVSRRTDRTVNALPPPKRVTKTAGGGKKDQNDDEPEQGKAKKEDGDRREDKDNDSDETNRSQDFELSKAQLNTLRHQIYAFKILAKNLAIPKSTQEQLFGTSPAEFPVAEHPWTEQGNAAINEHKRE